MIDEGRNESFAPTVTPVRFGDVEGIEQHCPFTVGMNELVPINPTRDLVAAFSDQQYRLRPPEKIPRVKITVGPERSAREFGD